MPRAPRLLMIGLRAILRDTRREARAAVHKVRAILGV
jgi:hypothetical protein